MHVVFVAHDGCDYCELGMFGGIGEIDICGGLCCELVVDVVERELAQARY